MTEANIYQLSKLPWTKGFPKLLDSIVAKGNKVLVHCHSEEFMGKLDDLLWTYEQLAFLPHATCNDAKQEIQPILLTNTEVNANNATVLAVSEKTLPKNLAGFEKIVIMYERHDALYEDFIRLAVARFKKEDIKFNFFKQNDNGAWERNTI